MPVFAVYNPRGYRIDGAHEVIPGAVSAPTMVTSPDNSTKNHLTKVNMTVTPVTSTDGRVLMTVGTVVP